MEPKKNMKKIAAFALGLFLASTLVSFAEPTEADKKWLGAVKTMVTEGKNKVTTPSQERVDLLKKWGADQGYTVKVTKTEKGFALEVTRKAELAAKK